MRHGVKKIKFRSGRDANKMLMRKLAVNFIRNAKIETTLSKAKVLKSVVEKLVEKAKVENEANKNYLLKNFTDKKIVAMIFKDVGQTLKDKVGGYVRIVKLGARHSDGTAMARLEWVYPVVTVKEKLETKKETKLKEDKSTSHSGKRTK
ncbi:50S ribosomal protein L17 [Candidatus Roizmanbacteria bacterium RIFCSPLOWO2_01_FULL_37_13]|uniref:50S ribosomal protein L17 n=1 Tax=Candidatus Roizmanbacteria bacterium RIFCSPHIGHO2_02_FULL_38_11 TaxID=1802039 RepID=A0A1F7H2F7_9BACT|nr:MAG: 50S ribosomal protein L17 [Candidatus Roizmanbacteria bacterium RIFCSPHIGHO2_02_FULL_38_11]OGK40938.1 MAG: 50S ribosomal protein L17 [Candidatus Roizmanbacteria bacterium RIFCSPLOWO2_01_FULL_37_13]